MKQQKKYKRSYNRADKENVLEEDVLKEADWQRWQVFYGALRRKMFLFILQTLEKGPKL